MRWSGLAAVVASVAAVTAGLGGTGAEAAAPYTVRTLHLKVVVGPGNSQTCDVVGDLYTPRTAGPRNRMPAVLTTNGFGGSKDDQAPIARLLAKNGYVVLSYSGLGFGGSSCKITLNDPAYDGKAGRQLVSFLGGARGIAFTDEAHTKPVRALRAVKLDKPGDPRVGMLGGSYGGGIQFAVASVDRRLDTIVPLITWNDLSYSLGPNNAGRSPGAVKVNWGVGFSALGVVGSAHELPTDPARAVPCPNFADFVCPTLVTAGVTGYFQPDAIAAFKHASVSSYVRRVRIPTLLMQGQDDTLFNLNEAVATYRALRAQGTPVKMVWHSWGHSGPPAPGEIDLSKPSFTTQYQTGRVKSWFDHHLMDRKTGTGPRFAYFRDWVDYSGNARPAYASSSRFPVGTAAVFRLSGTGDLTGGAAAWGTQTFTTPGAGAPSSINPFDVLSGYVDTGEPHDGPGTFASWTSAVLTSAVDVVGSPVLHVKVDAPSAAATQGVGPAGQLVLFAKLLDVAPDGTESMIHGLEAPMRVADVTKPLRVTLPAIVHRFAPGHRFRLVVAGGSTNYRGGLEPTPVTIVSGAGQTLTLPVL